MAISDYLNDEEWNACFYAANGKHRTENFGRSMHMSIDALLAKGYRFDGLDESGDKKVQISSGNAAKVLWLFGLGDPPEDPFALLDSGRNFWKLHAPEVVNETDEEWAEATVMARTQVAEHREKQN